MVKKDHLDLSERNIRLEVKTGIEGPLAGVAKAPRLCFLQIAGTVTLAPVDQITVPADVTISSDSLRVLSEEIKEKDREHIRELVADKVLKTASFAQITFHADRIVGEGEGKRSIKVEGKLTLLGVTRPITLEFTATDAQAAQGKEYFSSLNLRQSDYGIRPISTMMGAIRCRDEITIEIWVELDLPADPSIGRQIASS